jgi:ATP-dependent Lon protease
VVFYYIDSGIIHRWMMKQKEGFVSTLKSPDSPGIYVPEVFPVIPLRNTVFFPRQVIPLSIGRESTIRVVDEAVRETSTILLLAQKDSSIDTPVPDDVYHLGTTAKILKVYALPDGTKSVLVQGMYRAKVVNFVQTEPYLRALSQRCDDVETGDIEEEALIANIRSLFRKVVDLSNELTSEHLTVVMNMQEWGPLADATMSLINASVQEKQEVLENLRIKDRLVTTHLSLNRLVQRLELGNKIQSDVQDEISKNQREYFLREQMKAIRKELGEDDGNVEIQELRKKIDDAKFPPDVKTIAEKELERLSRMNPASAEYTVSRTYLDWLLELPWSTGTEDRLDIGKAREVLDAEHYGLDKVKKRILEYLAVRKLKKDMKGPILCFVGPPGVGKTSLGRSIANALGRKFVRISLGGVHDEAEIRGHRRTYIGALPGRIIQGLKKAGSNNPVFMLDEVDKIGMDFRGDPSSALLEVLDPEQNFSFSDHYIEASFDLSNVMFITTANMLEPIPPALRDRMEIIEIPSYTEEEKLIIAKRFLVPKQVKEHGLEDKNLIFDDAALKRIITSYTKEAGVRSLERRIADVCRGAARDTVEGKHTTRTIAADDIVSFLGKEKFYSDVSERISKPGIATGLAWTPVGGDILFIEATKMKGKGGLIITGQLGDIMKESIQAAVSYIASNSAELGIEQDFKEKFDIHVHVPAGAIPKDGPSAGVTMLTALVSLLTNRCVRNDLAMTGEITLRGAVLPIGGVKEKVLAAARAGITMVVLPDRNRADVEEIPGNVRQMMEFFFVKEMGDVLKIALQTEKAGGKKYSKKRPPHKKR